MFDKHDKEVIMVIMGFNGDSNGIVLGSISGMMFIWWMGTIPNTFKSY